MVGSVGKAQDSDRLWVAFGTTETDLDAAAMGPESDLTERTCAAEATGMSDGSDLFAGRS